MNDQEQKKLDDFYNAFIEHKGELIKISTKMENVETTMSRLVDGFNRIAVLEEDRIEARRENDEIFKRLRELEKLAATLPREIRDLKQAVEKNDGKIGGLANSVMQWLALGVLALLQLKGG